ncbi:MAG: Holliday junction branch migration protein RuvA [Thermodesulfobacteriota bacterium]
MIASLRGILQHKGPDQLIVDIHGVGYEVMVAESCLAQLPNVGQEVFLHIHTHVREDALQLMGFLAMDDKKSYQLLLSVSGVGPKLAMAIVAALNPGQLARAVSSDDLASLTGVSGVGKKTAKRLCLELKDKVEFSPDLNVAAPALAPEAGNPAVSDCLSALTNLGYPEEAAQEAVNLALSEIGEEAGLEDLLRQALRTLA